MAGLPLSFCEALTGACSRLVRGLEGRKPRITASVKVEPMTRAEFPAVSNIKAGIHDLAGGVRRAGGLIGRSGAVDQRRQGEGIRAREGPYPEFDEGRASIVFHPAMPGAINPIPQTVFKTVVGK